MILETTIVGVSVWAGGRAAACEIQVLVNRRERRRRRLELLAERSLQANVIPLTRPPLVHPRSLRQTVPIAV